MADDKNRSGDMILAPNQYMFVRDDTKGHVDVFVGPTKQSLSGTDQPVVYDERTKDWREVRPEEARQIAKTAPEGWYVVLKNPATSGKPPSPGGKAGSAPLDIGKKVNIPGHTHFALWPGQMAKVLKGHHLRSNQYLLVQVYDETEARKNWQSAVVKPAEKTIAQGQEGDGSKPKEGAADASSPAASQSSPVPPMPPMPTPAAIPAGVTMGQLLVIKGTDVSFYIPPTGIEVVPDGDGKLVREAVTLERLEYCLLLDENGNKRYARGPAVVFPRPTEVFAESEDGAEGDGEKSRKFRAIELNETQGLYIKVIADYEEDGKKYAVGQELFVTGKEQMIYFPREEHAIIKYDNAEKHFGIAIPAGEARYVLDRSEGTVSLKKGPCIFLPDPREQVVVRRILDYGTCALLYPGNSAALEHNAAAQGLDVATYMAQKSAPVVFPAGPMGATGAVGNFGVAGAAAAAAEYGMTSESVMYASNLRLGDSAQARGLASKPGRGFSGASFERKTRQVEPRTLTLSTKYEGAVAVNIYTGYAMLLVRSNGDRRVVQGPQTVLLEYDEVPEVIALSTGKPKTTDNMARDVYLRVRANKVSDIVAVETGDFCTFEVKVSYRMNFEGDPGRWFDVENYVKFMCDHIRSRLKGAVREYGVEEFFAKSTEIVRDVVLGRPSGDGEERPGMRFKENGMHVYDVEVLSVKLQDQKISDLIVSSQRDTIESTLRLAAERRKLEAAKETERIKRETAEVAFITKAKTYELQKAEASRKLEADLAIIDASAKAEAERMARQLEHERAENEVAEVSRLRSVLDADCTIGIERKRQEVTVAMLEAEVRAHVERAKAITPDLVAALDTFGERAMVERITAAMAPMALLGGGSVAEIVAKMLAGTSFAKQLTNGTTGQGAVPAQQVQARS